MRVALIVPALRSKGPVIVARDIAAGLCERGITTVVFYLDKCPQPELDFPCRTERLTLRTVGRLRGFDIVHSHSLRPDACAWVLKNLLRWRKGFITTIHNYVDIDLQLAYGRATSLFAAIAWKWLWRGLDDRVALTRDAQRYYSRQGIETSVIYNSRQVATAQPICDTDRELIMGLRKKFHLIGSAAAVVKRKGLLQVISALPFLPDCAFVLVGDGPELEHLRTLATELGVEHRFLALGFRKNARDYLSYFDVYALPSESEGMPLALLEAAQAGVPIVCSDIPVHQEIFHSDEVFFFARQNTMSLVDAISASGRIGAEYAARAGQRVATSYTKELMISQYVGRYSKLQAQHG
jgi:L-malate glycosyltransferase